MSFQKPITVVIGGSGWAQNSEIEVLTEKRYSTKFQKDQIKIQIVKFPGCSTPVYFLPRHGYGHSTPPHLVNELANFQIFMRLGIQYVINFTAVGSLQPNIYPEDIVLYDNILDLTHNRPNTFTAPNFVFHVPTDDPFCPVLKKIAYSALKTTGFRSHSHKNCVCIQGPTFVDRFTSLMYQKMGLDIVGMTQEPQRKLACEAGLCMISIALVTDFDCWNQNIEHVTAEIVEQTMKKNLKKAIRLLAEMLPLIPDKHKCNHCYHPITCLVSDKSVLSLDQELESLAKLIFRYDKF